MADELRSIEIENLKHIRKLTFSLPRPGVHLLTGGNGCGKTSLLACLRRIGYANAFAQHFPASTRSPQLDSSEGAMVTYVVGDDKVTYRYAGTRWAPTPKSGGEVLRKMNFDSVHYVGATAERITPKPEGFSARSVKPAQQEIIDAANRIFGTDRFNALRTIRLQGRGNDNCVFLLQKPTIAKKANQYFTERNFSLGELCVIKLVRDLQSWPEKSLVLIDELELALHPRAQIELYEYLVKVAEEKQLTVIFSTHSVSLIKNAPRSNIMYLNRDGAGEVKCQRNCFPARILGSIALNEERSPDVVLYVEDDAAEAFTDKLVHHALQRLYPAENDEPRPVVRIVPIGGYDAVLSFLDRGNALLPARTKVFALLDADVKTDVIPDWRNREQHDRLANLARHQNKVAFLPTTPEVGLMTYLRGHLAQATAALRQAFDDDQLQLRPRDVEADQSEREMKPRKRAKNEVRRVIEAIAQQQQRQDKERVHRVLFTLLAQHYFRTQRGIIQALLNPKLR